MGINERDRGIGNARNPIRGTFLDCGASAENAKSKQHRCDKGLMAPQPSSLRTLFRALLITRIEVKKSGTAEGARYQLSTKARINLRLN